MTLTAEFLGAATLAAGAVLLLLQSRSKIPGWLGLPLFLLTASAIRDVAVTPFVVQHLGLDHASESQLVGRYTRQELPEAMGLLLLGYCCLAGGMLLARFVSGRTDRSDAGPAGAHTAAVHLEASNMAWRASVVLFAIGTVCSGYILLSLSRHNSLFEIATNRAFITDETVVFSRFYLWARMLAPVMQVGAWGMLLFLPKRPLKPPLVFLANLLYVAFQVILGSRLSMVSHILGAGLILYYGNNIRIRRMLVLLGIPAVVFLGLITWLRFGHSPGDHLAESVAGQILVSPALDATAFALRTFPTRAPFLGAEVALGGLANLLPTLNAITPHSLWGALVEHLYGGRNPIGGIGGEHYVFAAEHYIAWGYAGVAGVAALFGVLYGGAFEWQRRHNHNPFLLLLLTGILVAFFRSLTGKMGATVGGLGFSLVLPIGFLTALAIRPSKHSGHLFVCLYLLLLFLLLRYLTGWDFFDFGSAAATAAAYIVSLRLVHVAGAGGPLAGEREMAAQKLQLGRPTARRRAQQRLFLP